MYLNVGHAIKFMRSLKSAMVLRGAQKHAFHKSGNAQSLLHLLTNSIFMKIIRQENNASCHAFRSVHQLLLSLGLKFKHYPLQLPKRSIVLNIILRTN